MASVSKLNDKELLQCLCLAYFTKFSNHREEDHEKNFYNLFYDEKQRNILNELKRNYLSENFPLYELLIFLGTTSPDTTKKKAANTRFKLKRIYITTKNLIQKRLFVPSHYFFLDSSSELFQLIKTKSIQNIKKALKLPSIRIDILSSIDILIIRRSKIFEIYHTFNDQFKDTKTIINNGLKAGELYASLFQRYIDNKYWFPISLKLPETIYGAEKASLKLISQNKSKKLNKFEIDPYIKFLSLILKYPTKTTDLINKLITINFNDFILTSNQNWTFPIDLNYNAIEDPDLATKLYNYKLSFDLLLLEGGSWNGQWSNKTSKAQSQAGQFGGLSLSSFEKIIKQNQDFNVIFNQIADIRERTFNDIVKKYESNDLLLKTRNYSTLKSNARRILNSKSFLSDRNNLFNLPSQYFKYIDDQLKLKVGQVEAEYKLYFTNFVRGILGTKHIDLHQIKHIEKHFEYAQLSYFIFRGGKNLQLLFKKIFIVMLYGWITKKSLSTINLTSTGYYEMKNVVEGIIEDKQKNLPINKVSFTIAPHYILT